MKPLDQKTVADCMTRGVITIKQSDNLIDAIRLMERRRLSAIPVVDGNEKLCGILSTSDLISLTCDLQSEISVLAYVSQSVRRTLTDALAEDNDSVNVASAICDDVTTIDENAGLAEAANRLLENTCHHLVVVDADAPEKPIGILSTTDIVRAVAGHA